VFRVAWWLLLAWAVGAAVLTALDALHFPSDEVLDHLIWASALYAVVAFHVRRHLGEPWTELVRVRGFAPKLLVPVVLTTVSGLVLVYQCVAVCEALRLLPPVDVGFVSPTSHITPPSMLAQLTSAAVIAPVFEEAWVRGLVLYALAASMSRRRAVVISALFFALMHHAIERFPGTFILGLLYGWMYVRTGSLIPSIIAHALHNATIVMLARAGTMPISSMWFDQNGLLPAWLVFVAAVVAVGCAVFFRKQWVWRDDPDWRSPVTPEPESCERAA